MRKQLDDLEQNTDTGKKVKITDKIFKQMFTKTWMEETAEGVKRHYRE